jgi:hypothetical protein
MSQLAIAMYVDRAGNPPAKTVNGLMTTAEPAKLGAILAAIGLEVRPGGAPGSSMARTIGIEWSVVEAAASAGVKDEKHHFLVEDLRATFERAVAAGATVELAPRQTSWGFRAIVADADHRKFVLTESRTTVRDAETTDGGTPSMARSTSETEAPDIDRRSSNVHLLAALLTLVGNGAIVIATASTAAKAASGLFELTPLVVVCSWLGIGLLILSKVLCWFDGGRLVGTHPVLAALALDTVALGSVWYYQTTAVSSLLADMGLHSFLLSLAIFAFYWQEAAGTLRLEGANRLLGFASVGFLTATICGLCSLLSSNRVLGIAIIRNWGAILSVGAVAIGFCLFFAGLVGVAARLIHTSFVRRSVAGDEA